MTEQPPPLIPPMPEAPPLIPPAPAGPPAPKDRRVLRAVLRWTAAVVVFAVVGAGTAYGITRLERTDVPGLATESDGRWEYPTLTKPPLPSGSPGPLDGTNTAGTHHADLRALLLPAPRGAEEDRALRGKDGWLATGDFLAEYPDKEERAELRQRLVDSGLRHVAARGWTTQDGTHTRVYLLHFGTAAVVDDMVGALASYNAPNHTVRGAEAFTLDEDFAEAPQPDGTTRLAYVEAAPSGAEQVRQAYVSAGDVLAVIVQSRKGTAHAVPFRQTVMLQTQLLG
ncbi:hypothetical protein IM697_02975 [Streptomyces ferrugineus]|uniref:Uncharacterized protein n=2 Tax=Streptomyces ferrugineus TaxID=1413221 RepID=A0A7M2SZI5_9ACTN|nr:hypothetical protein [Streptomyces ferrugineus]QOV40983.1 hypothetical protein IM697_02975 [Streptomyces ferrugineus]